MTPGTVLFWKDFTFDDGGQSDKLLIVVGGDARGYRLMLKTTSQPATHRPDHDGCHADHGVHRFKQYLGGFLKPTWVQFDTPIIKHIDVIRLKAHRRFDLLPSDLNTIVNCYRKTDDISDVLSGYLNWR
jgi:hypothetical protein